MAVPYFEKGDTYEPNKKSITRVPIFEKVDREEQTKIVPTFEIPKKDIVTVQPITIDKPKPYTPSFLQEFQPLKINVPEPIKNIVELVKTDYKQREEKIQIFAEEEFKKGEEAREAIARPLKFTAEAVKETKDLPLKISNIPEVQNIMTEVAKRTTTTGIYDTIKSIDPDVTFQQAYEATRAFQANDPSKLNKFLYQLSDSIPQTLLGVGLLYVPFVGKTLSTAYWTSLSAAEQIESKGKVESLAPIAIDVVGDRILGNTLEALFKAPAKTLAKTILQTFTTEGGTEVAQDLLKLADEWRRAETEEQKRLVMKQAKEYFTSGQILTTFVIGGISGALVGGGGYIINQSIQNNKIKAGGKELTLEEIHSPEGEALIDTLSTEEQERVSRFDNKQSLLLQIQNAQEAGKDVRDLVEVYESEFGPIAPEIQVQPPKVEEVPPTIIGEESREEAFEITEESEGVWDVNFTEYKGRPIANFVYNFLDKKQKREYDKIRDQEITGTRVDAENKLQKLIEFQDQNQDSFLKAKQAIDNVEIEEQEITKPQIKKVIPVTEKKEGPLVLKPSQAKTEAEKEDEIKVVGEQDKPLVKKSDFKTIIANNAEFKAQPFLQVDEDKSLSFKGEMSSFKIKPPAIGLNEDNLQVGDEIELDTEALKAKGAEQQLRVYKGGTAYADVGVFINDNPVELGSLQTIRPIEFPELVRLSRELMGQYPTLKKFPKALGMFYGEGEGAIKLNPELFKQGNEPQLTKTLAHEIGHLTDYLPDHNLKRGNMLARLLSLNKFLKTMYSPELGTLDLKSLREQAQKEILEEEGYTFGDMVSGKLPQEVKDKINVRYHDKIPSDVITNAVVKEELTKVTNYWRPFDRKNSSPGYIAYRNSAPELYADAISMLFNTPGTLEKMAPTFYKTFFEYLDNKPEVKQAYFELQKQLAGTREDILKLRGEDIRKGFEKAEELQKGFMEEKKLGAKSLWEKTRQQLDDINYPILKKQKELEARGELIPEELSPKYILEEQSLVDNENFLMVDEINRMVDKPLADVDLSREDFGEYLFLNRVIGKENVPTESLPEEAKAGEKEVGTDRQDLANPWGFKIDSAKEQLAFLKKSVGPERFKVLEESAKNFHEIVFRSVEEAVKVGSYNQELFETKIKDNKDTYVTFAVVDYLQDKIPATIKAQKGTLKEIANPYTSTILKTIALNRLNAFQRSKIATKELLTKENEITPSKERRVEGKVTGYIVAPDKGALELLENGKLKSYDIDPYIAKSFEKFKTGDLNTIVWMLDTFNNKLFKPLVTTYNLGFAAAFNPIRDFRRNYKLIPNATIFDLLNEYRKALPSAVKFTKGELTDFTRSLVESKAINSPAPDYQFDLSDDTTYERILDKYGLLPKDTKQITTLRKTLLKPITKLLEGIRFIANTLEIVSKIAGAQTRVKGGESGKELSYNIRNYTGTPNYRRKGIQTKTTNAVFTFSNIIKEGLKSDIQIATNPNTRTGYWWKTVKIDLMPKLFMFLAAAGYFGKELKDMFDKMTEYDKSNYLTIPLGYNDEGKVIYVRIPHDETGRLISSIFWKILNFAKDQDTKNLQDIFAFSAGQLPTINPAITILSGWTQYLSGKNPYDSFRGRSVIDDTTFTAGGGASLKKMAEWTVNTLGISTFATYDTSKDTTLETFLRVTPWFNRVIKMSDYGLTEDIQKEIGKVKREEAKVSLIKREVVEKYAQLIDEPKDITNKMLKMMGEEIYGEKVKDKAKLTSLKTALLKKLIRGDDPRVDAILTATSNKEKLAAINLIKVDLSKEEFNDLRDKLIKFKIISGSFAKTLKY
jgi:hypothetical protein